MGVLRIQSSFLILGTLLVSTTLAAGILLGVLSRGARARRREILARLDLVKGFAAAGVDNVLLGTHVAR